MKIEFYFDPSCPFCWITSRWLLQVAPERQLDITWKPFCLALKNDEMTEDKTKHGAGHRAAARVLRVMLAAAAAQKADLGELYTAFGFQKHIMFEDYDDSVIAKVLADKNLPAELLSAADDTGFDTALRNSIAEAVGIVGDDVGVPIIVFVQADGSKTGYFGPVLERLPDKAASLELWDGLSRLAASPDFYELKRSRPSDGPDTASTARC